MLGLMLLGLALRLALAWPSHTLQAEADSVVVGLTAFEVMRGETPVFNVGYRNGALGGYLAAVLFWLFGTSRGTLAAGPALVGIATMIVWYLFYRAAFDRRTATVALAVIAVPAPAFLFWTSLPNTYPETLLLCATVLWLATLAAASPRKPSRDFALGLAAGLGWWSSPLTLSCTVPAYVWLASRGPSRILRVRQVLAGSSGAVLGALPWLLFNFRYSFPSLRRSFATRSVEGLEGLVDNGRHLLEYKLPVLLASTDLVLRPSVSLMLSWLEWPLLGLHLAAASVFVWLAFRCRAVGESGETDIQSHLPWLLIMVAMATMALNLVSAAGRMPGPTVRYLLPLYLIVPGLLAVLVRFLASRSRVAASGVLLTVLFFNVMGAYLPWTAERKERRERVVLDDRLIEVLDREGVEAVIGNYFVVYPINFHTRSRIVAVPLRGRHDHRRISRRLGPGEKRWALVSAGSERRRFRRWLPESGLEGQLIELPPRYVVFVLKEPQPSRDFMRQVRESTAGDF